MSEFYSLPYWVLIVLIMLMAVGIILQTQTITYSFRRFRKSWIFMSENVLECVVLLALFTFALIIARIQLSSICGYALYGDYDILRQLVFLLMAVFGTITFVSVDSIEPLFVVCSSSVLLPIMEKLTGSLYPVFYILSFLFLLLRSAYLCWLRRQEINTNISFISIKEAIDNLRTCLLLFRSNGDVLLSNQQMDLLAKQMIGRSIDNGIEFQNTLKNGHLLKDCSKEILSDQQVFRIQNHTVWIFSLYDIPVGKRKLFLLCADDITQRWNAMTDLDYQNQILKQRGQELLHTIENLQAICEAEEIARNKAKVHDLLGQRISLLLRTIRDGHELDKELLKDFVYKLPSLLSEEEDPGPNYRLNMLKKTFEGIDVSIEIQGDLPDDLEVANIFANIAIECVTNAVRHGYASRVQFHFFQNDYWRMSVIDNGIPPTGKIREGGGITEMRRQVDRLGGILELHTIPRFNIQIFIPKEGL